MSFNLREGMSLHMNIHFYIKNEIDSTSVTAFSIAVKESSSIQDYSAKRLEARSSLLWNTQISCEPWSSEHASHNLHTPPQAPIIICTVTNDLDLEIGVHFVRQIDEIFWYNYSGRLTRWSRHTGHKMWTAWSGAAEICDSSPQRVVRVCQSLTHDSLKAPILPTLFCLHGIISKMLTGCAHTCTCIYNYMNLVPARARLDRVRGYVIWMT